MGGGSPETVLSKDASSSFGMADVELVGITRPTKNKVRQIRPVMLGQLIGHALPLVKKRRLARSFFLLLAEREEFEPRPYRRATAEPTG